MSKNSCKTKNKKTTSLKSDPISPKYQEGVLKIKLMSILPMEKMNLLLILPLDKIS